jgi:eukaryotic-like serine/threonine-protein kinase
VSLPPNTRLGPYEILASAGAGGMGEVYKARDTRLNRIVALKVAKERISDRFEREARAVAALNHPHVCQLYDIGPDYLVMEFVEGAPIRPGDTPQRIIELALQITDGLVAAHAAGVVHRDLKPANILVTRSGEVKLLDFGLATVAAVQEVGLASQTRAATDPGTTVGTVGYMSPEQARGEPVDPRTDLWSLGVVLYELATGERPFDGATAPVIFEALLNRTPPPMRDRNPRIPDEFERIVLRLLEKDRETRYQSAADLRADLQRVGRDSGASTAAAPVPQPNRSRLAPIAVSGGAVALALIAAAIWKFGAAPPVTTSPSEYTQITNFTDSATAPSLSPDGRMVTFIRGGEAFLSRGQIYVKLLPNGESVRLTNDGLSKYGPVFTPDGARIVYTLVGGVGAAVGGGAWDSWSVPALGGEPARLLPNASGLTWLGEHRVLFSEIRTGLHMGIVTATEGRAESRDIYFPSHERAMAHFSYASPDRESVLIVEMTPEWQPCRLVPLAGGSTGRQVGPTGQCTSAGWSPDGRWMYFAATVGGNSHLWRQRFPDGRPEQITFGPTEEEGIAVAPDGRSLITSIGQRQNTLWIHDGGTERAISSEGYVSGPAEDDAAAARLSADGARAYCLMRPNTTSATFELHTVNIASGKADPLFPGVVVKDFDISRDDLEVLYTTVENGELQIWIAPLDHRSSPRLVTRSGDHASFGANGEVVFRQLDERVNYLARVNQDGSGRQRISSIAVIDKQGVSPDGEWVMAGAAEEGKDASRHVLAIPIHGGVAQRVCEERCIARWSDDGRTFYVDISTGAMRGKTVAIPVPAGRALPVIPRAVADRADEWATAAGARVIEGAGSAQPGIARYVFTKTSVQRNLFRIPIH